MNLSAISFTTLGAVIIAETAGAGYSATAKLVEKFAFKYSFVNDNKTVVSIWAYSAVIVAISIPIASGNLLGVALAGVYLTSVYFFAQPTKSSTPLTNDEAGSAVRVEMQQNLQHIRKQAIIKYLDKIDPITHAQALRLCEETVDIELEKLPGYRLFKHLPNIPEVFKRVCPDSEVLSICMKSENFPCARYKAENANYQIGYVISWIEPTFPLGVWKPELTCILPTAAKTEIWIWLLVSHRLCQLPSEIVFKICEYIATERCLVDE